jgi:hypothetical protein
VLLNHIAETYQRVAGGALPWDTVILTGGGSAMLCDRLLPLLGHDHVILADEPDSIHLANVRGGLKLWRLDEDEASNGVSELRDTLAQLTRLLEALHDRPCTVPPNDTDDLMQPTLTDAFIGSVRQAARSGLKLE